MVDKLGQICNAPLSGSNVDGCVVAAATMRLVLMAIANAEGIITMEAFAKVTGRNRVQIGRAIQALERLGYITVEPRGRSNSYHVRWDKLVTEAA